MHKILFFVTEFWQAGGQRYTYEIDRALDKNKFDVHFLCFRDLNSHPAWADYYYEKHCELDSEVHFYSKFDSENILLKPSSIRSSIRRKKVFSKLNSFLEGFDTIMIQGEWVYSKFQFRQVIKLNVKFLYSIVFLNSLIITLSLIKTKL